MQTEVNPANGHTYHLLSESYWTPAEAKAIDLGGHLATVNDQAEHDWIWSTFSGPVDKNLWIGFNDSEAYGQSEGNWGWVSGEPVTFTNWWAGEPNGDGDFGLMWRAEIVNGLWGDRPDDGAGNPHHGVVEVVPEPTTLLLLATLGPWLMRRG
jgi:hypothetical protein